MSMGLSRGRELITEGVGLTQADLPPLEAGRFDPRAWFDDPTLDLEIEIGCGKGTFLVQQAGGSDNSSPLPSPPAPLPQGEGSARHSGRGATGMVNYIGIEWSAEFYRYAADRIRRRGLRNVRILHADATEFLRHWCADSVARVIHLYFSDPWPKKRHHKRRVVQDESLVEFHRVLEQGGELRLVTDHEDLWAWYEDHAVRHAHLFGRTPFRPPGSAGADELVGTNFERKYVRENRPFYAMTLRRREHPLE